MSSIQDLDKFFEDKTFVHGERLTVADLAFASAIKGSLDVKCLIPYKNINRYYNTVVNQPEFKNADNLAIFKAAKVSPPPNMTGADLLESLEMAEKKPKDPFESLPATVFNFDDYKRNYSNNPPEVYLPYFWEKFDKQNCSIWLCDYKFSKELGLLFMSTNLIRGALQRLDKARKNSFGSMAVFGQDHDNHIAGLWVWRGQDLMFKLTEDWQVDYESFDWKKLDPDSEETKKLVEMFFQQKEGFEYNGKKCVDGKIFK